MFLLVLKFIEYLWGLIGLLSDYHNNRDEGWNKGNRDERTGVGDMTEIGWTWGQKRYSRGRWSRMDLLGIHRWSISNMNAQSKTPKHLNGFVAYCKTFAVRPSLGKNKNNSAWPICLINYKFPPEIWSQTENLITIGVIPHGPKALDTFFFPLTEECKLLTQGVLTYDAKALQNFDLHAYPLTFSGDLPAISKLLCLWVHGTYSPYHSCLIQGECIQKTDNTKYYVFSSVSNVLGSLARIPMIHAIFHHTPIKISSCTPAHPRLYLLVWPGLVHMGIPNGMILQKIKHPCNLMASSLCYTHHVPQTCHPTIPAQGAIPTHLGTSSHRAPWRGSDRHRETI